MPRAVPGRGIPTDVKDPDLVSRRRRQIVDAAVGLFIGKGFHKTTTREIARATGFSIGTLYEYVSTKEDILYLVCEAIHGEVRERITSRLAQASSGARALAAAIGIYVTVCDQMSDHILLIYQETKSLPPEAMHWVLEHELRITDIFKGLLMQGVQDYSLRPLDRAEIELMAHNMVVMGHMWTFRRWALSKSFTLPEYIELQRSLILGELTGRP